MLGVQGLQDQLKFFRIRAGNDARSQVRHAVQPGEPRRQLLVPVAVGQIAVVRSGRRGIGVSVLASHRGVGDKAALV